MKYKVIPTIFALNKKEFENKLNKLNFLDELHLDFMDGEFVKNKSISINSMKQILNYPQINFQIHLMVKNPLKYLNQIKKYPNIKIVFFQIEAFNSSKELEKTIQKYNEENFQIGLVLNPDTKINQIEFYLNKINRIMFMSVWPGKEGQEFIEEILKEAKKLRAKNPLLNIQIDGGINDKTILKAKNSGINIFCVGSYISGKKNSKEEYVKLSNLIK